MSPVTALSPKKGSGVAPSRKSLENKGFRRYPSPKYRQRTRSGRPLG
jgi:hypothetical protein